MPSLPKDQFQFLVLTLLALPTWLSMQWHLVQLIFATSTWPISLMFATFHDSPESSHLPKWSQSSLHLHLQLVILQLEPPAMAGNHWGVEPLRFQVRKSARAISFYDLAALKRIGNRQAVTQIWPPQTGGKRQVTWVGRRNIDKPASPWLFYFDILWPHTIPNTGLQYMIQYAAKRPANLDYLDSHYHRDIFLSATRWCLWDRWPWPD